MNIIDAIKSGRDFFRASDQGKSYRFIDYDHDSIEFTAAELLADDWEIEQTSVTITREEFDAAWHRAEDVCENMQIKTRHYLYELIVRELGL